MKTSLIVITLSLLLIAPAGRTQSTQPTPPGVSQWPSRAKRYALLIGVNDYDDPQITRLIGPANDMRALENALVKHAGFDPERIRRLTNDQTDPALRPTRGNILRALSNMLQAVPPDGLFVLAFSGHGAERGGRAFLLPTDAQVNSDIKLLENTALAVADVKDYIRNKEDRATRRVTGVAQVLVLLDACRNDPTSGKDLTINPLTRAYNFDLRNNNVKAFATLYATTVGARAYENRRRERSYFIDEVVAALEGAARNERGEVTLQRLISYVEDRVPTKVTLDLGRDQQPFADIEGYRANDLVIAVAAVPPTPTPAPTPAPVVAVKPTPTPAPVRMSVAGVPLTALASFTTVTVDTAGRIANKREQQECWGHVEDLGGGVKLEMAEIQPGKFLMGEDAAGAADYERECKRYFTTGTLCQDWAKWQTPQHRVRLSWFLLGRHEVTQGQWKAVMGSLPPNMADLNNDFKGDNLPVVRVSWDEAQEFIKRLNAKLRLPAGTYRLPSEAEWEYAARAGTRTPFAFGETISPETANYWWDKPHRNTPAKPNLGHPVRVGSYPANAWGLFDMHGNVWEWCEDDWHDSYNDAPADGRAWADISSRGSLRVVRGGGWYGYAVFCRSALRLNYAPAGRYDYLGFRLART